jgi:hypothetical protein
MKQTEIKRLLPSIVGRTVRKGTPAWALLEVMEELHAPSEAALEKLDSIFNPHRTPDPFVTMLARWVNLERLFEEDPGEAASPASSFLPNNGTGAPSRVGILRPPPLAVERDEEGVAYGP